MAALPLTQVATRVINIPPLPAKFQVCWRRKRYKVWYGGRGGAKSWTIARALILLAYSKKIRVGCFRELQSSIKDSVHRLLKDQIDAMGLTPWFEVTTQEIRSLTTGSEFFFKGLRHNATEIKSTEGIDIAWVEEAQLVSKESWDLLIPTIRKEDSEIWVSFNPVEEEDYTYDFFVKNPPPDADVILVNWDDNPYFPQVLNNERLYMLNKDPVAYQHIWEGACKKLSDACIMKGKFVVEDFDTPEDARFFHGGDWGFANDPACLLRCFITRDATITAKGVPNEDLWIDAEWFGVGVEINDLPKKFETIDTSRKWPILADSARPETISYMKHQGFNIEAAEKWKGSIEDGIEHLRGFRMIHIHSRCKHMAEEARLYSYKVDKNTGEILPEVVDAHNHGWDAVRYALSKYIKRRGAAAKWARL